ncbi:MAG: FAD binding domain-containing protein [Negativicutes bacterium]|nr:FAD binding domain-containing protein [Negativicutes bacterium]
MYTIAGLAQPDTLEEAYRILLHRRTNAILGGCAYLRLGRRKIGTAIDLSKLSLNYIIETEARVEIGAMATLREIETHPALRSLYDGMLTKAVGNIIGVQFRNVATVGGSVFSRYGFSDLITALLALDSEVELYKQGWLALTDFLARPFERDILVRISIKKDGRRAAYHSLRNSASDYPLLNVAVSRHDDAWRIAVGARPNVAVLAPQAAAQLAAGAGSPEGIAAVARAAASELTFGSNMRASASYRQAMCQVLVKRAVLEVLSCR